VRLVFDPPLLKQLNGPHLNGVVNPRLKVEGNFKTGIDFSLTGHSNGYGIYTTARNKDGTVRELEARITPSKVGAVDDRGIPSFWCPIKIDVKDGIPVYHINPVPAMYGEGSAPTPSNTGAASRMRYDPTPVKPTLPLKPGVVDVSGKDIAALHHATTAGAVIQTKIGMEDSSLRPDRILNRMQHAPAAERRAYEADLTRRSKDNVITPAKPLANRPLNPVLKPETMAFVKSRMGSGAPPKLGGEEKRVATVPVVPPPTTPPPHIAQAQMKEPDIEAPAPEATGDIKDLVAMVNEELAKHPKGAIKLVIRPDGTLGAKVMRKKVVVTYEEEYL
jgi:hypothetical protein